MNFEFVDPWHLFLPREPGHVISLMGSGGKTTLMRSFAAVYQELGVPVILTTTTRSEPLSGIPVMELSQLPDHRAESLPPAFYLHGGLDADGKWIGLLPLEVDDLGGFFPDRTVLAEVDGAAKMPVKLYRSGEPVWPERTSLAIAVMGTGSVGSATADILHRFGRVDWPPLRDLEATTAWEWDHALTLLLEDGGYISQVPEGLPCVLALTGMGEQQDSIGLFEFVGRAMAHERLPLAMFCDLAGNPAAIRTVCQKKSEEA